jgi:hypothetical protein
VTRTVRSIVSDGLGMIQYPVGTCESSDMGDHIMGVVALAWCTDDALDRWGEAWARHGSIELRFRSHLTSGLDLTISSEQREDRIDLAVTGDDGTAYATGTLRAGPTTPFEPPRRALGEPFPVPPRAELLDRYELHPIEFEHVAERDLPRADRLAHGGFWSERSWAHPAWLASAANAIVRHNVAFEDGGYWLHAGIEVALHHPVLDGADLVARGCVVELFERSTHRFMVCDMSLIADGVPAASIRSTSVYGAAST